MRRYKIMFAALGLAAVWTGLTYSSDVDRYVEYVKNEPNHLFTSAPYHLDLPLFASSHQEQLEDRHSELLAIIKEEAAKRYIAPVDAKLDPVWKAIPGYNGLEVDVEKTLAKAEERMFPGPLELVYKEVPPAVQLEQLGPQPIYKGNPNKPMAALMINVAWGDEYLTKMLDTLTQENVKATFFFDGMWLKSHIAEARKIMEMGHEVSNHAYSHKDMSKLGRQQALSEITKTETLLQKELGAKNVLFAPPSGDFNQTTVELAQELKLKTILWTFDTRDWMKPEPSTIVRRLSTSIEPGSLILMHPTDASSKALPEMIRLIRSKKLQLGTVSEVISPSRVPEPA